MLQIRNHKIKHKKNGFRYLAMLLCIALCMENASLTVLAAETGVEEFVSFAESQEVSSKEDSDDLDKEQEKELEGDESEQENGTETDDGGSDC